MSSTLELDQDDITARLIVDPVCGQVAVFSQRKGVTENDIQTRLGALNQAGGKVGLVLIVLMPKLLAQQSNAPSAYYSTRYSVQVIDWPVMRRVAVGGIQLSAETIAERVRQILHFASFGRGQSLGFAGMEPLPMADPNQISYAINFDKLGADTAVTKCAAVAMSPQQGASPQTITLTCGTAGAAIYYTTDGSYPSSKNTAAVLYSAPFNQAVAGTVRAAAEKSGLQQSDPSQGIFT